MFAWPIESPRRALVALAVAGWLAIGWVAAYTYLHRYDLHRGFSVVTTPAGIPRGTVREVSFRSKAIGRTDHYQVYLPPGYARAAARGRRFPVLYLLHGSPGKATAFVNFAAVDVRENVLVAQHRMPPTILVMPAGEQGMHDTEWANTGAGRWSDFVMDVVHDVDHRFATRADRAHRGIAGDSEGAYAALNIGLHHVTDFSVLESWSGYYRQQATGVFAGASPAELAANSPADYVGSLAPRIRRLGLHAWLLQGRSDLTNPAGIRDFATQLHAAGADVRYGFFPGGHDWGLWRAQAPRMLVAAGAWFGHRPGAHAGFGHVGTALSTARRLQIRAERQRRCLALHPRPGLRITRKCQVYRAAHGLPNH